MPRRSPASRRRAGRPPRPPSPIAGITPADSAAAKKSAGRSRPRTGWSQRSRASAPTMRPEAERDDRLVDERQLARAPGRRAGRASRLEPLAHGRLHAGLEHHHLPLARALRPVHRDVRVAQQVAGGLDAPFARGDAEARAEHDLAAGDANGQRAPPRPRAPRSAGRPRDHRRSSTSTANSSPPSRAAVSPRARNEAAAASSSTSSWSPVAWPKLSLTFLKSSRSMNSTVTGRAAAPRAHERVLQPLREQHAVGEVGERVVERLVGEALLEHLALVHAAQGQDRARRGWGRSGTLLARASTKCQLASDQRSRHSAAGVVPGLGRRPGHERARDLPVLRVDDVEQARAVEPRRPRSDERSADGVW